MEVWEEVREVLQALIVLHLISVDEGRVQVHGQNLMVLFLQAVNPIIPEQPPIMMVLLEGLEFVEMVHNYASVMEYMPLILELETQMSTVI